MGIRSSNADKKVSDPFPVGLQILLVDDDPQFLSMLRNCLYEVTAVTRYLDALVFLREHKFDLVMIDVDKPEIDGVKLLQHIGLDIDLPVIMMSAGDSKDVLKGIADRACDYLIKPVKLEQLRNIWHYVVQKQMNKGLVSVGSMDSINQLQKPSNGRSWKNSKRMKEEEDEEEAETNTMKRPRFVWSDVPQKQFIEALNKLGVDRAVPKKILELMNYPGVTRENVASHLQKYRMSLKRPSNKSQQQSRPIALNMIPSQVDFGSIPSFNGFDIQGLSISSQLPEPTLHIQPVLRNPCSSYASHYIPTHLAYFNQPIQSIGNMGMQLGQEALGTGSSENIDTLYGNHARSLMMQMSKQLHVNAVRYHPIRPQPYQGVEFPINETKRFPEQGFHFIPTPGMLRDLGGSGPTYSSEFHQNWEPRSEVSQHANVIQDNFNVPTMVQKDIVPTENNEQNVHTSIATSKFENEHDNPQCNVQGHNTVNADMKAEKQAGFSDESLTQIHLKGHTGTIGSCIKQQEEVERICKFEVHPKELQSRS